MKNMIFGFFFLCATAALGQTATVLTNNPQPLRMADHVEHATEHAMATESSLFSSAPYGYAQGERPLAEFATPRRETPLGDVARAFRKERATTAKASKVSEN